MCGRVCEGVCLGYIYKGRGTRDGSVFIKGACQGESLVVVCVDVVSC